MSPGALARWIATLDLPAGLVWAVSAPVSSDAGLFPVETRAIARAVAARRAEFAGGRHAARAALAKLGMPPAPIPVGPGRAPVWPAGVVGSLTHTRDLCLAVCATTDLFVTLGIDLEPDHPLDTDLVAEIALPGELFAQGGLANAPRRLFSAKEALFKAQFPLTGAIMGFQAMRCDMAAGQAEFTDHPDTAPVPPGLRARGLPVRQWCADGVILSLSALPAGL